MELREGRKKFIETWGHLASSWGVPRTMAQIHALLLTATRPMCADEVMEELGISRGNANMNLRELVDWGLIAKENPETGRKEFFTADKDTWSIFRKIAQQRKKRELEPVVRGLDELTEVVGECPESEAFVRMVRDLKVISSRADALLEKLTSKEAAWLLNGISGLGR